MNNSSELQNSITYSSENPLKGTHKNSRLYPLLYAVVHGRVPAKDFLDSLHASHDLLASASWQEKILIAQVISQQSLTAGEKKVAINILDCLVTIKKEDFRYLSTLQAFQWLLPISGAFAFCNLFIHRAGGTLKGFGSEIDFIIMNAIVWMVILFPCVLCVLMMRNLAHHKHLLVAVIATIGCLEEILGLNILSKILYEHFRLPRKSSIGQRAVWEAIQEELPKVLNLLSPDHYGCFDNSVINSLCLCFAKMDDKKILQVLDALEKIGNGQAIRPLERLIVQSQNLIIHEKAFSLLPLLRKRKELETNAQTLVRASTRDVHADTLLRPAQNTDSNSAQLLRPGNPSI